MFKQRLLAGLAAGSLIVGFSATVANAIDVEVGGTLQARQALTGVVDQIMDFGIVDYAAIHSGDIELGTDGAIDVSGATGLASFGTPAAAQVTISGVASDTVDITCDTGATLDDAGAGDALTLTGTEIILGAGNGVPYGDVGATSCAGVTGAGIDGAALDGAGNLVILMGAAIDTDAQTITADGTYTSTDGTGSTVTLRVLYE